MRCTRARIAHLARRRRRFRYLPTCAQITDPSLKAGRSPTCPNLRTLRGSSPMRTLGSLSLCRSLLEAGLVDRFRVVVFPVITGSTRRDRIYDGYPDVALDMIASQTFDGRIQLLEYVPTVLTGPPGTHPTS